VNRDACQDCIDNCEEEEKLRAQLAAAISRAEVAERKVEIMTPAVEHYAACGFDYAKQALAAIAAHKPKVTT